MLERERVYRACISMKKRAYDYLLGKEWRLSLGCIGGGRANVGSE